MNWFVFTAIGFVLAAVLGARRLPYERWARGAAYFLLATGILVEFSSKAFQGSETSLMGYFAFAAALLAVGALKAELTPWASVASALLMSLGFDVLRPDAYSYVPAAILASLVLAVAVRAFLRLSNGFKEKTPRRDFAVLAGYIFLITSLVYSALFKVIDRGWALPWAYMAGAGVLLFAAAQLWLGWKKLLKKQIAADWLRQSVSDVGILLMMVSAFFVYKEFL